MKNDHRPVNINLIKIKLPISALTSITHRLAGMYIFFITYPLSVYLFYLSISSSESFINLTNILINSIYISTFVAFSYLVLWYHILTGVRHLIMDMHIGESLDASKYSSILVLLLWALSVIAAFTVMFV
ncbi:succinate dehydrogenase, cytochrome b556 subunit [Gammaproteobacteria bacterium]|nr:succinate dehydrogenase, cytochrome b556 subunit [Gammaproteobacteria bacterium]